MIEVKQSDSEPSPNFQCFYPELKKANPDIRRIQLVRNLNRRFTSKDGIEVEPLIPWLETLDF